MEVASESTVTSWKLVLTGSSIGVDCAAAMKNVMTFTTLF